MRYAYYDINQILRQMMQNKRKGENVNKEAVSFQERQRKNVKII